MNEQHEWRVDERRKFNQDGSIRVYCVNCCQRGFRAAIGDREIVNGELRGTKFASFIHPANEFCPAR